MIWQRICSGRLFALKVIALSTDKYGLKEEF